MKKLHYYQVLLLLGSLLAGPLHATHFHQETPEDDCKYSEEQQKDSSESFYEHGDLTFIHGEKDKVNLEELKQGLIDLSYRIKAKDSRKVYFFVGATGAGKSFTILVLQGHKIEKIKEEAFDSDDLEEEDISLIARNPFEIVNYVLPKHEVPDVKDGAAGKTASTYIYYPDPKKEKCKGIAFADTEGFLGKRKATSAGKCLSVISFSYALQVNKIGGLVFVISAHELGASRGEGLERIAHILQQYFAKAVSNQTIQQSILVMVTKVTNRNDSRIALRKFKQNIQLFYQGYYAEPDDKHVENLKKIENKGLVGSNEASAKKLAKKIKKQEENRRLKCFFEMLLEQDVPKTQMNDINNFKLNMQRFCFLYPWHEKSVQKILDQKLSSLQPIASDDICPFDNPVSQYMQSSIRYLSMQLSEAINALLALKFQIDTIEKHIAGMKNKKVIDETTKALEKRIDGWLRAQNLLESDNRLEVVFAQSHYEYIPADRGWLDRLIERLNGYKLYSAFQYTESEPIYQIVAIYGPEAGLSESRSYWHYVGGTPDQFNFIAQHFNITAQKHNNGTVTWNAVAKKGKGVVKKDGWQLYHVTTGEHKAQCKIKFYARKNERIATLKEIEKIKKNINRLRKEINEYKTMAYSYNELSQTREKLKKKLKTAQPAENIKARKRTVHMLQFLVDEIIKDGADKKLIKMHLKNYDRATQLFLPFAANKGNNQKNKPQQKDVNRPYQNQLKGHHSADNEVFDID